MKQTEGIVVSKILELMDKTASTAKTEQNVGRVWVSMVQCKIQK